jgi:hypothetical protein
LCCWKDKGKHRATDAVESDAVSPPRSTLLEGTGEVQRSEMAQKDAHVPFDILLLFFMLTFVT